MNWFQFFSSLVASLAWPATILVLALTLRSPVTRVLLTLTRLKYKDLELDFGRELRQLEAQAKSIEVQPEQAKPLPPTQRGAMQLLAEAERLAQEFPGPAVAVGWQAVEDELQSAVMRLAISPGYPPHNSSLKNAELLLQQRAVNDNTIDLLKRMRNLRNMAVHGTRGAGNITTDEAIEFIALARGVVNRLSGLTRP